MQQWYQCPNCGAQLAFGTPSCPNCRTQLNWPAQQQPPPQYQQQYQQPQQPGGGYQQQPEPPKRKKKSPWLVGCLGLVGLLVLVGAIVIAADSGSEAPPSTPPSTSAPPATTPPSTSPPPATFAPITKSGTDSLTTAPFTVTTDEWIIDWSFSTSDPEFAVFGFFIYPRGETELYTEMVLFPEATSGSTYSYAGPGEYYIKTNVANIDEWEITIKPAN